MKVSFKVPFHNQFIEVNVDGGPMVFSYWEDGSGALNVCVNEGPTVRQEITSSFDNRWRFGDTEDKEEEF